MAKLFDVLCLGLAAIAAGAQAAPGLWQCRAATGTDVAARQLEFDPATGNAAMLVDSVRSEGRFTLEHGHLVAVLGAGATVQELTLGTASGRVLLRQRQADGSTATIFRGLCRRTGEAT